MKRFHMVFTTAAFVAAAPAAFAQMNYSVPPPQQERQLQAAPKQDVPNTATATAVHAAVEAPKPTCEDPGAFPGRVGKKRERQPVQQTRLTGPSRSAYSEPVQRLKRRYFGVLG